MGYYLNPAELAGVFAVPASVVDKHIKLASGEQLKVLLWSLRNSGRFDAEAAASALKSDADSVAEAFEYWKDSGILCSDSAKPVQSIKASEKTEKKVIKGNSIKPTRDEAAKRGLECPEIAYILRETEQKFGRLLRQAEISTLVWLYDDQGLNASLILMIVGYAVTEGRPNIGFIERTAVEWAEDGVTDIETAENRLVCLRQKRSAWHTVETAMGIEHRQPSASELDSADKWVNDWGYGRDILKAAYDACVDSTSKFSIPYIKKILSGWHTTGVKTVSDIPKLAPKPDKGTRENGYEDFVNSIILDNEEN